MKCVRCRAENPRHSTACWACGIRLHHSGGARKSVGLRPEAMRFYSASSSAVREHHAWLDGLVLVSTILFGFLLVYFLADVLPASEPAGVVSNALGAVRGALSQAAQAARPGA